MSWEEDFRRRYPCPCGKGECEEIHCSDDWGRSEASYKILCPICKEKYVYDNTMIGGHRWNERKRGWVLKSVLEAEQKHKKNVEEKAKKLYFEFWKAKFKNLTAKKLTPTPLKPPKKIPNYPLPKLKTKSHLFY